MSLISKTQAIGVLTDSLFFICNNRYCLVPERKLTSYRYRLEEFNPNLDKELEIGLTLKPTKIDSDGVTYEGDDQETYRIDVDWQVRSELSWGFTTINRLQGYPFNLDGFTTMDMELAIRQNKWRFAKSQPKNPHWYITREKWEGEMPFDIFVLLIRQRGYNNKFRKWKYRQYNIGDFFYWTMGAPLSITVIINRAVIV